MSTFLNKRRISRVDALIRASSSTKQDVCDAEEIFSLPTTAAQVVTQSAQRFNKTALQSRIHKMHLRMRQECARRERESLLGA